jgi:hypothetical protein
MLPSLVCSGRHSDLRKVAGAKSAGDVHHAHFWWVHPRDMQVLLSLFQTHVVFVCLKYITRIYQGFTPMNFYCVYMVSIQEARVGMGTPRHICKSRVPS